jgi:hypothetical protein
VQTAASKLIPPRKIGAIPGQHLPPFIQGSQKNAPFESQGSQFMSSNSRRNFTTAKDYKMSDFM